MELPDIDRTNCKRYGIGLVNLIPAGQAWYVFGGPADMDSNKRTVTMGAQLDIHMWGTAILLLMGQSFREPFWNPRRVRQAEIFLKK